MAVQMRKSFLTFVQCLLLILSILLSLLLFLELLTRVYSHFMVNYDLEMFKYARDVKQVSGDLRGHTHQANKQANLMGVSLQTDSFGRRLCEGLENTSNESNGKKQKILFLGDSVTLGWGVPSDETFVCRLAKGALAFDVVNAGVGNYNIQAIQAQFASEFAETPFRAVIYSFYTNDLERAEETGQARAWWEEHSYFFHFLFSTWHRMVWALPQKSYDQHYFDTYRYNKVFFLRTIERLRDDVQKNQSPFVVLLLPDLNLQKDSVFLNSLEDLEKELLQRGIQVVPVYRHIPWTGKEGWISKQDAHPNPSIHQKISEVACKELPWLCQTIGN